jgi:hypothetical protein
MMRQAQLLHLQVTTESPPTVAKAVDEPQKAKTGDNASDEPIEGQAEAPGPKNLTVVGTKPKEGDRP